MSNYLFCHKVSSKVPFHVCERQCGKVGYCVAYWEWDYAQYCEAEIAADEARKKLEEENGVIRKGE